MVAVARPRCGWIERDPSALDSARNSNLAAAALQIARIREQGFFVERRAAEENSSWKQVIPYVVVKRADSILLLERKKIEGEVRLHGKLSIGVGGHINPEDAQASVGESGALTHSPIDNGSRREIAEELHVSGRTQLARVGVLNDDSNPVGAVHVGLVQLMLVEGDVRVATCVKDDGASI